MDFETFESRLTSFDDYDIGSCHAVRAVRCLGDGGDIDLRYGAYVGVALGNIHGAGKTDGEGHGRDPYELCKENPHGWELFPSMLYFENAGIGRKRQKHLHLDWEAR